MANPMTEPLEPYEPAEFEELEWEYDQEQARSPHVLWGRVAVLGGMLLIAFFLGRTTKSAGVPEAELDEARSEVRALQQDNEDLKSEVAAAEAARDAAENAETTEPATGEASAGTEDTTGEAEAEGMNYTVKPGDTLTTIAEETYGDASLDDFLAEYNEITDPTALSVGQTIFLPDDTTP